MSEDNKSIVTITLCLIAGGLAIVGIIWGLVAIDQNSKDRAAERCAEYGYSCEKD